MYYQVAVHAMKEGSAEKAKEEEIESSEISPVSQGK